MIKLDKNINKILQLISPKLNFCGFSIFLCPRVFQSFLIEDKEDFLNYFLASPEVDILYSLLLLKKHVFKLKLYY